MRKLITLVIVGFCLVSLCFADWDNTLPGDNDDWDAAAGMLRDNWDALEVELGIDLAEAHPYYQSAAPTKKPDGSTALDVDDNGRIWIDSDDNKIYVLTNYSVPTWTVGGAYATITESDATMTLQNTDEEDSDGGRQSRFIAKGEQSGGEATTLGYIEFSHDGTSDDEKGQFLITLNDGDDTDSPSNQAIGYLSTGKIDVSSSLSVLDEDDLTSDDDEVLATQQSIKKYIDDQITAISVKGWVNFDGTDADPDSTKTHLNVSSITDNGTGDYTITWDTDFASAAYAVGLSSNSGQIHIVSQAAGSIQIRTSDSAGSLADTSIINAIAFGTQ